MIDGVVANLIRSGRARPADEIATTTFRSGQVYLDRYPKS
jgi:hypothetical protein